ncbi:hypothetical protein T03_14647 [Trichinella britovi]|uniref:Uncharacterized protein n=1 Tax=Trichinella britovi TaxID=45882 RepID=A0A0V0ZHG3_TRIBR|nr:hypothetical protein T03_14647 [Trichinella britovi]
MQISTISVELAITMTRAALLSFVSVICFKVSTNGRYELPVSFLNACQGGYIFVA